ncbi:DNA-binding response regulator [Lachnoclostridium sp. An169]|uniref:LytR/AlgR family response regulator transcription factor n=1 Tax=Lachnoclostridium sp. An169 TaxID=1965569 RepID=UPI000B39F78C|nr:LytTR family DNA-binding domain-containing protein [Lachnoclostridium sp. An169]OUP83840.1 DNA-binding response regulator [Lachnoclostridium sp. An169]HJA67334.1 LytTR family DNA-binding domain-containing protein [Candidatus Mediterraneibacter cottocaccae]
MIHAAIVEDEKEHMELLQSYLNRYASEHSVRFRTDGYADGIDIVSDYKGGYDVIFLDIQMKHMDGMTAAERIRHLDEDVAIIFITSTVQFAVQGYLVDALGYVLKPVPYLAFEQLMNKAVKKIRARKEKNHITLDTECGMLRLATDQICCLESQKHAVIVHCEKETYRTAGPLKRFDEELSGQGFSRCHNAYLVNLSHVNAMTPSSVRLSDGEELPVSRARKKAFMDALTDYIGGIQR